MNYEITITKASQQHKLDFETDQRLVVIQGSIDLLNETGAEYVDLRSTEWNRRILPECFLSRGSGFIIAKEGLVLTPTGSVSGFLRETAGFKDTSWGLVFAGHDHEIDFMAHKYLTWRVRPAIARHFAASRRFEWHVHATVPEIPPWLDAEYFADEKVIAVYGVNQN